MDVAAIATGLSQAETGTKIAVAIARKAMDAQRQQGDAAIALLQAAAEVQGSGGASAPGVGERVDVRG